MLFHYDFHQFSSGTKHNTFPWYSEMYTYFCYVFVMYTYFHYLWSFSSYAVRVPHVQRRHTFVCRHFSLYHSIARIFMFINYSFFRFLLYSKWNSMRWYVRIGWIIFRWNGLHSILFPKRMKLCSFQIRFRWCNRLWLFLCTHAPDINWKLFKLFTQFSRLQCGESTFEIPSTLPPLRLTRIPLFSQCIFLSSTDKMQFKHYIH